MAKWYVSVAAHNKKIANEWGDECLEAVKAGWILVI